MRALVLEDDLLVARGLTEGLARAGYAVEHASTASEADQAMQRGNIDVAIVDLGLPLEDGLTFIRRMRDQGVTVPMLILTARDTLEDCVGGLDAGADDYLTKPFRFPELLARLRAAVRRQHAETSFLLTVGPLRVNLRTHEVYLGEEFFALRPREREVLESLMTAWPGCAAKANLFKDAGSAELSPNAIEVSIFRLRQKLAPLGFTIRTVRGIGYRLEEQKAQ
ncbi:MAG TPA: response regulator [Rhodocyclaceae bacterium]